MKLVDLDDPKVVHLLCNLEPKWKPMAEYHDGDLQELGSVIEKLHKLAVDAAPVRHGRWIPRAFPAPLSDSVTRKVQCNQCKTHWDAGSLYCPYCGAKMDLESVE